MISLTALTPNQALGGMMRRFLGDLFDPDPDQWGLRGDPLLWHDMRAHFGDTPLPGTEEELENEIASMFKHLTGRNFSERKNFHVPKYDSGGMSSGFISPRFWHNEAMPLLRHRLAERE